MMTILMINSTSNSPHLSSRQIQMQCNASSRHENYAAVAGGVDRGTYSWYVSDLAFTSIYLYHM